MAFALVPIGAKILGAAKGILGGSKAAGALKIGGKKLTENTAAQLQGIKAGADIRRKAGDVLGAFMGQPKGGLNVSQMSIDDLAKLKTKDVLNAGYNMSDDAGILDRIRRSGTIEGFTKNLGEPLTREHVTAMLAPDLFFGGMAALQTEGDLIDKAIAGVGATAGGAIGGIGTRGMLGPKSQLGIMSAEFGGGMLGDSVGYGLANNLIRLKNGGMTPAEQSYAEGEEQYRAQLMQELKQQYGL